MSYLYSRRSTFETLTSSIRNWIWRWKNSDKIEEYDSIFNLEGNELASKYVELVQTVFDPFHPLDTINSQVNEDVNDLMTGMVANEREFSVYHTNGACVVFIKHPFDKRFDDLWMKCWYREENDQGSFCHQVVFQFTRMSFAQTVITKMK